MQLPYVYVVISTSTRGSAAEKMRLGVAMSNARR
jgi:hypothetical protein